MSLGVTIFILIRFWRYNVHSYLLGVVFIKQWGPQLMNFPLSEHSFSNEVLVDEQCLEIETRKVPKV